MAEVSRDAIVAAIRDAAEANGRPPSRSQFIAHSGIGEYHVLSHFPSWNDAVRAAGLEPDTSNLRIEDDELLADWALLVRRHRHIPTRFLYRREGRFSPGVFDKHFGPWSAIPGRFRQFAASRPEWADVVALLPLPATSLPSPDPPLPPSVPGPESSRQRYSRLADRPTYGNPLDFRGLRHEPVNENGVVFLFGIVARELGFLVEAVQAGFPDCEAKRQVGSGLWQRVRIEFEYESRNFRDHGHAADGCDVIVCWRHNWPECPPRLEVVELCSIIRGLAGTDE